MPAELMNVYLGLPVFALVLSRLGGLIMFQPVLGGLSVPPAVRALIAIAMAALVTPFVTGGAAALNVAHLPLAIANELALGALLGLAVRMCFLGLELGGLLIATESGLAFGRIADPNTGVEQSMLSTMYVQLGVVVFLIVGGHRVLMEIAIDTFQTIPLLTQNGLTDGGVELLFSAITLAGQVAIRAAAPVLITLFLINLAMGFVSRTVPQLNILTVGFSLKGLVAFVLMAVSVPAGLYAFTTALEQVVMWVREFTAG